VANLLAERAHFRVLARSKCRLWRLEPHLRLEKLLGHGHLQGVLPVERVKGTRPITTTSSWLLSGLFLGLFLLFALFLLLEGSVDIFVR